MGDMPDWYVSEAAALRQCLESGALTWEGYVEEMRLIRNAAERESDEQDMRDAGRSP